MERKRRGYRAAAPSAEAMAHRRHGDVRGKGHAAGEGDALPARVAEALGTSQRAAQVGLWGPLNLAQRCARVITALKLAGEDEALVQFIQPIDLAIHTAQPTAVTHDEPLPADAVLCDADPSPAVPTPESAQAYLNRLYQDIEQRAARRPALEGSSGTSPGSSRVG
jgi:hypothetical protein